METEKKKSNIGKNIVISAAVGTAVATGVFFALKHSDDITCFLREDISKPIVKEYDKAENIVEDLSKKVGLGINNQIKSFDSYFASITFLPKAGDYLQVEQISNENSSMPGITKKVFVNIFRYPSNPNGNILEKQYILYTFQGEDICLNRIYKIENISSNGKFFLIKDIKNGKELILSEKAPSLTY
ncbi:MAG: hypothetical protein QXY10_00905 [Candidatus Micrarchaeaceae archaeon]